MPDASGRFKGISVPSIPWSEKGHGMNEIKSSGNPATAREERARLRKVAGWNPGLVSALDILEYGCDEGDYDDEVAAVMKLVEAARAVVDAANKGHDVYAAHPALLTLEAALERD